MEQFEALVVESKFSSRREIMSALHEAQLVSNVREALSVADGLSILRRGSTDVCFIGPALTLERSVEFLREKSKLPLSRPCAAIAVMEDENDPALATSFLIAGADATFGRRADRGRFSEIVRAAVLQARSAAADSSLSRHIEKSFVSAASAHREDFSRGGLSGTLHALAARFRSLAGDFESGHLRISLDGRPSLAGQDAIRLAFESAFPPQQSVQDIGSADHFFITLMVEWMISRTHSREADATKELRQNLLRFFQPAGES
jgi:DNA-binding NarL/FixJ family response regulator